MDRTFEYLARLWWKGYNTEEEGAGRICQIIPDTQGYFIWWVLDEGLSEGADDIIKIGNYSVVRSPVLAWGLRMNGDVVPLNYAEGDNLVCDAHGDANLIVVSVTEPAIEDVAAAYKRSFS